VTLGERGGRVVGAKKRDQKPKTWGEKKKKDFLKKNKPNRKPSKNPDRFTKDIGGEKLQTGKKEKKEQEERKVA